ncbi:universal stress protein [Natrarchaeobaculum sulfurireducens]|uniref:Amino acid transporter n=1 Tax=Natrarchaeobaculum sulfurireducens TaxID=2044521 RepID=A0A346PM48_9EURY|nr:universal stress protein [Natrarchaeobaculum sulfurireducens]AXR76927.1 Amino acid transporter [Natrarchaeobaculum sulfurireducens]AXR80593.1 amino acid transporter [Natrarchaeobaculum sulfurireducens]
MPSGLKRDLGLAETFAIAVGAMIGSGIFVLPGVAWILADAAAVLGFVIAAVLVLPAALAVAEMSTAIPEDGGPYLYVERSMGPLLGTIAGIGTWLMLSLKSALALVGGVPYLLYVSETLAEFVTLIAVVLAIFFTVINLVSAEGSGKLQFGLVGILIAILAAYVFSGVPQIEGVRVEGAFSPAVGGSALLEATAIVFISYAGLTKVGAVAEEVEDPGRNLPLAIGLALAFVSLVYAVVVYVTIGVLDIPEAIAATPEAILTSEGEGAIIALAAEQLFDGFGNVFALVIVVAALLALASTANAGILAASRFPLAMARDGVLPSRLEEVSERFTTPVYAVALTGLVLIALVAIFPIQQVAAFGSAFQILVFILLNVALIGFREGAVQEYDPEFEAPLYPWMPLFGIAGGFVVLAYTGIVAVVGAVGIGALAGAWYFAYVRYYQGGIDREGVARAKVRESVGASATDRTRGLFESEREYTLLVAITEATPDRARRDMLRIALDLGRLRSTAVSVVEFYDEPEHILPSRRSRVRSTELPDWLPDDPEDAPEWFPPEMLETDHRTSGGGPAAATLEGPSEYDTHVEYRRIVSEDHKAAIVDFATFEDIDLIITQRHTGNGIPGLLGASETAWLRQNAPCDVALVEDRGLETVERIAVASRGGGPYDPVKLLLADAVAEETGAEIVLVRVIPEDAPESRREAAERYHSELMRICTVPVRSRVLETDSPVEGMARFVADAELLIVGAGPIGVEARFRGSAADDLVDAVDCTTVMVQTYDGRHRGLLERFIRDYLF